MSQVITGQPLRRRRASEENLIDESVQYYLSHLRGSASRSPDTWPIPGHKVTVKNSTVANREEGDILELDDKLIDTLTAEEIWLDGVKPSGDSMQQYGVLLDALPDENIEEDILQLTGVCLAKINIDATWGQYHPRAKPVKDSCVMVSGFAGPVERIWPPVGTAHPEGTGEQVCVVLLHSHNSVAYHAVTPAGGIAAATYASGSVTPQSEECDLWVWDHVNDRWHEHPNGVQIEVENDMPTAISGGYFIKVSSDQCWRITVDVEACEKGFP